MKISPARKAAFDILQKIEVEKAFSSVLLPIYEEKMMPVDRGLCHEFVLGVLRRQIFLDCVTDHFSLGKKIDIAVRIALRLGLYQLLFLDKIPAYSAINESVELVKRAKKTSAAGFVNAILRTASKENAVLSFEDEIERISVEQSHPRWLVEKWANEFGFNEAVQLVQANNQIPEIAFRFTARAKAALGANKDWIKSKNIDGCFFAKGLDTGLLDLAESNEIYFQDEASQMAAGLVVLKKGDRFLDVCAAPGSKTTAIVTKSGKSNQNNLIVAGDLYKPRVEFLRKNCLRQGVHFVNVVQYDAETSLPFAAAAFDIVLVDAPCSGTGTIRHNPEIRYFISPEDFSDLSRKQLAILKNASKLIKDGGLLIYSTCSLEREENEDVVRQFLLESENIVNVAPDTPGRFLTADGYARTFPHRDNMDGFFMAVFKKNGS